MRRLLDVGPRLGARRARAALVLAAALLAVAGLTATGLSISAEAAGTGEIAEFAGVWTGEFSPEPGVTLPASELVIQDVAGRPNVTLTWFRHQLQEDGSFKTERMHPRVTDPRVTGRTLRFRVQSEIRYRPDSPQEKVESDQVFELLADRQGRLRQVWSSLEGRQDVPPPPPPTTLRRRG